MRRYLIPSVAFILGTSLLGGFYAGFLGLVTGWDYAAFQFQRDAGYVIPIIAGFGIQSALFSILRFRLFAPLQNGPSSGTMLGTSGGTSATAMVACCIHHVTTGLPLLGLSAATVLLARYQRPMLQASLVINLIAILVMLAILMRARRQTTPALAAGS